MEKHRCEIKRYGSQGNEPCVLTGIVRKVKQVYLKKALFISELTQTFLYKNVIDVPNVSTTAIQLFHVNRLLTYFICCVI